jgi:hypothetical protein
MHQRKWLRAVAVVTCSTWALVAQEAAPQPAPVDARPGETVKVPAHRSKWDFPKEVTLPEKTQIHVVQTGDTLWDLGNKYLGNPFSWPQIWELNKWITDPHWIYPSDYLLIPSDRQAVIAQGEAPSEVASLQPERRHFPVKPIQEEYAFAFQDFIQMPYLAPNGAEAHFRDLKAAKIVDNRDKIRTELGDGENVYLDSGAAQGLKLGDRKIVLRLLKTDLRHPNNEKQKLGDVIKQVGVIRLIQVDEKSAVAVIEKSMDGIKIGDRVASFTEPATIANKLRTDIAEPVPLKDPVATVVYVPEFHSINGPGEMMIINQGAAEGLKEGDNLLVVQKHIWSTVSDAKNQKSGATVIYLAQAMVVKAGEHSATCRVLRGTKEIMPGDLATR